MLIALAAVVAAVALAALGAGGALPEVVPDRLRHPLPQDRPLDPGDVAALRLAVVPRGYRMWDVDDVLDRLGAELAHRDATIAELEARLAGRCAARPAGPPPGPVPAEQPYQGPQDAVPHPHYDGGTP